MQLDPTQLGVAAVAAAATLTAVKTIDYLVRRKENGHAKASCGADAVMDRLVEYHLENRDLLTDIRDGIRELIILHKK